MSRSAAPRLSRAEIPATVEIDAVDETGSRCRMRVSGEYPLTIYVDKQEIVTLMTLGRMPEALVVGYLRNQRIVGDVGDITDVQVDWETGAAAVSTRSGAAAPVGRRTVTSGCGQGTMFGDLMEDVDAVDFRRSAPLGGAELSDLLRRIRESDTVYKSAGAVHGCALAERSSGGTPVLLMVEDVGRHNAIDTIAGWMWLNDVCGDDKIFYTTGRLTSEMVVKCAQIGVPFLVSRSGLTRMGHEVAHRTGITMIGRAVGKRFLLFSGEEHFDFGA